MAIRWVRRKAYQRRSASGTTVHVRPCWVPIEPAEEERKRKYRHTCPGCNTGIVSVRMPNGGWVHYFAEKGLTRVKHPCLHLGEGMSKTRDKLTLDLLARIGWSEQTLP